jgi:hypothetical protein
VVSRIFPSRDHHCGGVGGSGGAGVEDDGPHLGPASPRCVLDFVCLTRGLAGATSGDGAEPFPFSMPRPPGGLVEMLSDTALLMTRGTRPVRGGDSPRPIWKLEFIPLELGPDERTGLGPGGLRERGLGMPMALLFLRCVNELERELDSEPEGGANDEAEPSIDARVAELARAGLSAGRNAGPMSLASSRTRTAASSLLNLRTTSYKP